MKFNWGHGLTIFFILFVGTLIFLVIQSRKVDRALVVDNYYDKDIHYQAHKDKLRNTARLTKDIEVKSTKDELVIEFPKLAALSGTIHFYRASDQSKDFRQKIKLDADGNMRIDTREMIQGTWVLKIDWVAEGKSYYSERQIYLDP